MKKPPPSPEFLAHDALYAERLVALVSDFAVEHHLTEAAVMGALSWVLGQMIFRILCDGRGDLETCVEFFARQLRRAAVGECARRPTLH